MIDLLASDVATTILIDWLVCTNAEFDDPLSIARLDAAFTNHDRRHRWLALLQLVSVRTICITSNKHVMGTLKWFYIRNVQLDSIEIEASSLKKFAGAVDFNFHLPTLKSVSLTDFSLNFYTGEGLIEFLSITPNLRELDLYPCSELLPSVFEGLLSLSMPLRVLLLPTVPIVSSQLMTSVISRFSSKLKRIQCGNLADADLLTLSHSCRNLRAIGLFVDQLSSRDSILTLLRANPELEEVYLDREPMDYPSVIDDEFVQQFVTCCCHTKFLFLPNSRVTYHALPYIFRSLPVLQRFYCPDVEIDISRSASHPTACMVTMGEEINTLLHANEVLDMIDIPIASIQLGRGFNSVAADGMMLRRLIAKSQGQLQIVNINLQASIPSDILEELFIHSPKLEHIFLTVYYAEGEQSDGYVQGMQCIGKYCPTLQNLSITFDINLVDDSLLSILKGLEGCPLLSINLMGCQQLSERTLLAALRLFPKLETLEMKQTAVRRDALIALPPSLRQKVLL